MNERMKELAAQAGFHFDEYNESTQRKVDLLTELIVSECVNQCHGVGNVIESIYAGEEARRYTSVANSCERMIKQYFNIK